LGHPVSTPDSASKSVARSIIAPIEAGPEQLEDTGCATSDPDMGPPDLVEVDSDSDSEDEV